MFLFGIRYRSDGAVVVNLVLYWGWGHREPWYLATSLPDAKVAVGQYRRRMQLEQYFRDGKQYFALDRGTATTTARLGRMLVGALLACCLLPLVARRASVAVSAAGVFVGEAGTDGVGDGMLSGCAGAPTRMIRLIHHLKVGTPEWVGQARAARAGRGRGVRQRGAWDGPGLGDSRGGATGCRQRPRAIAYGFFLWPSCRYTGLLKLQCGCIRSQITNSVVAAR